MSEFNKGVSVGLMILVGVLIICYVMANSIIESNAKESHQIGYDVGYDSGYMEGYDKGRDLGADTVYQYIDNIYENGGLVIGDIAGDIIINGCTFRNVGGSPAIDLRGGARNIRVSNCMVWGTESDVGVGIKSVKADSVVGEYGTFEPDTVIKDGVLIKP